MSYHDVPVLVLVVLAAVGWLEVLVVIVVIHSQPCTGSDSQEGELDRARPDGL